MKLSLSFRSVAAACTLVLLLLGFPLATVAQAPVWKNTVGLGEPETLDIDSGDTLYIMTSEYPSRLLKIAPNGQTLGYPVMMSDNRFFWGRVSIMDTLGRYLLAGGIANVQGFQRPAVAKIDLNTGLVIQMGVDMAHWPTAFTGDQAQAMKIGRDTAGQVYLLVNANNDPSAVTYNLVLRFSPDLQLNRSWLDPNPPTFYGGVVSSSGACYVNGAYYDPAQDILRYYVEKIDFTVPDTVAWRYNLDGTQLASNMLEMPNGDLLWLTIERQNNNVKRSFVHRVQVSGTAPEVIWSTEIPVEGSALSQILYDPANNRIFVGGSFLIGDDVVPEKWFSGMASLDAANGDVLWHYRTTPGGRYGVGKMAVSPSGQLTVVGAVTDPGAMASDPDYWAAYFTDEGVQTDLLFYDGNCQNGNDGASRLLFRSDGKLIVSGTACEDISDSNWCTTLMYDGIPVSVQDPALDTDAERIQVFPNPATDWLTISPDTPTVADLSLWDSEGRLIRAWNQQSLPVSVYIAPLPAGVYQIRYSNHKTGLIWVKK